MDRRDMYCQVCDDNIWNAMFGYGTYFWLYYECDEVWKSWGKVKEVYPTTEFEMKSGIISLKSLVPKNYNQGFINHINKFVEDAGQLTHIIDGTLRGASIEKIEIVGGISQLTKPEFSGIVQWHEYDKEAEYYMKAGLVLHKGHSRNGRMANGCYFCKKCAEKLDFKCDQCGSELGKNEPKPI